MLPFPIKLRFALEVAAKTIPVRRVGQPRDVANVICFLASEEASYVSGQVIYVAGGPR
jgi:3-oxoacyl-[acyl-carrier protein] reductase